MRKILLLIVALAVLVGAGYAICDEGRLSQPVVLRIPGCFPIGGLTLRPLILLKREWNLPHEMVHFEQQGKDGLLRFLLRYYGSPTWRVRYEAPAYAVRGYKPEEMPLLLRHAIYLWAWPLSGKRIVEIAGEAVDADDVRPVAPAPAPPTSVPSMPETPDPRAQ